MLFILITKNLIYTNFNTDRVIRWRLIIEEYGPDLRYVEGPKNVVADALSRLGLKDNPEFNDKLEQCSFYEEQIMNVQDEVPIKSIMELSDMIKADTLI